MSCLVGLVESELKSYLPKNILKASSVKNILFKHLPITFAIVTMKLIAYNCFAAFGKHSTSYWDEKTTPNSAKNLLYGVVERERERERGGIKVRLRRSVSSDPFEWIFLQCIKRTHPSRTGSRTTFGRHEGWRLCYHLIV